ncbi:hypothetical protein FRB94_012117 [Tulasnella sp. JGI-2019a]|nr:hypothetical protein FRB94_012117 [Tulasnella sp. JGI-2019a]KAG8995582.1 hypothetical protein FRB93_001086 [Tulasnella sp. JGI-2019a]KAG9022202.1 hypothetical protein FRB95_000568 [Tulasnella sp. JGI-2019a]
MRLFPEPVRYNISYRPHLRILIPFMAKTSASAESNISSDSTFRQPPVPVFLGTAGEDVTEFVRRLQSAAFARGLRSHDDWIADYASTLLSGEALVWWSSLEAEVQTSWSRLREALLAQFQVARMTASAPEPATAAPPPRAGIMNRSSQDRVAGHTIPSVTTVTLRNITLKAWASAQWCRLRDILLPQFPIARMMALAPEPPAATPPPRASIVNRSSQDGGENHAIPPLIAVTPQSIAVTAWASSQHHGGQGIRIYRPEHGYIQEMCNKHGHGRPFDWEMGRILRDPVGISDTAPMAAANSFGLGIQDRLTLYYVARDNHLHAFQFDLKGQWERGPLDVQISGICTSLHAAWHAEPNGGMLNSVWTICWIAAGTVNIKQERYSSMGTTWVDYSCSNWSKVPLTLVAQKGQTPEAVLFTTDNTEHRSRSGGYKRNFTPVNIFPANLAHHHCVAGIDCDPLLEMRFFLTEQDTINQYTFDLLTKRSSGPLSLIPRGQVLPGSPIITTAWQTRLPTIFVFFLYTDNKVGFYRYDYAVPPGQGQSIHWVQL